MDPIDRLASRDLARLAGALYLLNILAGFFAIGFAPAQVVVPGDAAVTVQSLHTHELLYRLGLTVHFIPMLVNIPLAVILYELFKSWSRRVSLVTVAFMLVATAIEAATLLDSFTPLALLGSPRYASAFTPEQLQAFAYLPFDMHAVTYNITSVFFGCYCLSLAYLACGHRACCRAALRPCWQPAARAT